MANPTNGPFVTQIDPSLVETLREGVIAQGFALSTPAHTHFQAKKPGVSCTLYLSGKLVVQGKGIKEFIEFYLEPEILGSLTYTHPTTSIDRTPRIGGDEAGKGDFFGPLCITACYADEAAIDKLATLGVTDSKRLTDRRALALADQVSPICTHETVVLMPEKYNELYQKFRNLNTMLAWGHATALANVFTRTGCRQALVDQFAYPHVLEQAVARKEIDLNLTQRTKAEDDIVVAAASILARAQFLRGLKGLSKKLGVELPKGANNGIIELGIDLVHRHGPDILNRVAKLHFRTAGLILDQCSNT